MTEKDAKRNPHPAYCTCVICVEKRLVRQRSNIFQRLWIWIKELIN